MLDAVDRGGLWCVGALDFELGYLLEPATAPAGWVPPADRPLARFWRFARRVAMDAGAAAAWLAGLTAQQAAGVGGLAATLDEKQYEIAVDRIIRYIAAGDCYQVNFTFPLEFEWFGAPAALYARLREQQPVRYGGFVGARRTASFRSRRNCSSRRPAERLVTRPMKGTLARHEPPEKLRASLKDQAENLMIVDLLRNDLGRIAAGGSVEVRELFAIEDYPTVWQMVSEVSARAVPGLRLQELLRALFPCGSITGAPKIRAAQIIGELEGAPRGLYTGAFGWIAPDGDLRLNVAIRTLELHADHRGRLGIGSGIVADSQPAAEWRECQLKAGFMRAGDPGLKLIETLRRENGVYPMWAGHLARLRRSAAWLGFPLDEQALCRLLGAQPANGIWRVRLTLDKAGRFEVDTGELTATPPIRCDATRRARVHFTTRLCAGCRPGFSMRSS